MTNPYTKRRRKRKFRITPRGRYAFIHFLILGILIIVFWRGCDRSSRWSNGPSAAPVNQLLMVKLPEGQSQYIKEYTGFIVSFNPDHHIPNYSAWELTRDELRHITDDKNKFHADEDVPGCPSLKDYRKSGYDRGHMAPAGDMRWSKEAHFDCCALTNICPQVRSMNGGRWNTLEQLTRTWVERDSALLIITGPVLSDPVTRRTKSGISVPDRFFKVILAPYARPPRAIAFIIPNVDNPEGLSELHMSVDELEKITGCDFFSALPDDIEEEVERKANYRKWQMKL